MEPSPILLVREGDKSKKYSKLVTIATKQAKEAKRPQIPAFIPFVMADTGELSPVARELQEWIIMKYKGYHRTRVRTDGVSVKELVYSFRSRLAASLQFAVAAGLGAMLITAGQPWRGLGAC